MAYLLLAVNTALVCAEDEELLAREAEAVRAGCVGVVERGHRGLLLLGRKLGWA